MNGRFWTDRLSVTAAAFQLTRADVSVGDPNNPSFQLSIGEQRVRGVEISAKSRAGDRVDLYAAYAYTDSVTTDDSNAALVGKPLRNVPRHTLALDAAYQASNRLAFGLTASHVGKRSADLEQTFDLPAYWRVDLRVGYQFTDRLKVVGVVQNTLNEEYYSHAFSLYEVFPAAPRTFKLALEAAF